MRLSFKVESQGDQPCIIPTDESGEPISNARSCHVVSSIDDTTIITIECVVPSFMRKTEYHKNEIYTTAGPR
jgi:hypothetical protein